LVQRDLLGLALLGRLAAQGVAVEVGGDLEEPGLEPRLAPEGRQPLVDLEEGLLGQVPAHVGREAGPREGGVDLAEVGVEELPEDLLPVPSRLPGGDQAVAHADGIGDGDDAGRLRVGVRFAVGTQFQRPKARLAQVGRLYSLYWGTATSYPTF